MTTSNTEQRPAAISDEQLMRYLDGELGEEAEAELVALLGDDADARDKLAGLDLVGGMLREAVEADDRGGDLADGIMAEIEAGHADELPDSIAELEQKDLDQLSEGSPLGQLPSGSAANDNARNIYMVAAAAAAVAAGLWFYSGTTPPEPTATARIPTAAVEATALPQPAPETTAEVAPGLEDEEDVEIAAIDFGSGQAGSVFHISGGDKTAASTTVLWVTDLGDDE